MSETVFPQPQNVLDSTVARIASAVENMVPSNVCVNISTSLLPADWSSSAPYIQVWTNNKVTDECAVKVEFPAEAASTNITYLEFEKVAGGVKFTAPVKPATAIPVIVHIINAEAESITDISADLVSTSAVPNASNVEEGLETLNSDVTALNSKIATQDISSNVTTDKGTFSLKQVNTVLDAVFVTVELTLSVPLNAGQAIITGLPKAKGNYVNIFVKQGNTPKSAYMDNTSLAANETFSSGANIQINYSYVKQ